MREKHKKTHDFQFLDAPQAKDEKFEKMMIFCEKIENKKIFKVCNTKNYALAGRMDDFGKKMIL